LMLCFLALIDQIFGKFLPAVFQNVRRMGRL